MTGNNHIVLNIATMRQALEYWLNNRVFSMENAVTVTAVGERAGYDVGFEVYFSAKSEECPK